MWNRKCRLCSSGLSGNAGQSLGSFDILFIELSRRWDGCSTGSNFPGTWSRAPDGPRQPHARRDWLDYAHCRDGIYYLSLSVKLIRLLLAAKHSAPAAYPSVVRRRSLDDVTCSDPCPPRIHGTAVRWVKFFLYIPWRLRLYRNSCIHLLPSWQQNDVRGTVVNFLKRLLRLTVRSNELSSVE